MLIILLEKKSFSLKTVLKFNPDHPNAYGAIFPKAKLIPISKKKRF